MIEGFRTLPKTTLFVSYRAYQSPHPHEGRKIPDLKIATSVEDANKQYAAHHRWMTERMQSKPPYTLLPELTTSIDDLFPRFAFTVVKAAKNALPPAETTYELYSNELVHPGIVIAQSFDDANEQFSRLASKQGTGHDPDITGRIYSFGDCYLLIQKKKSVR